jgi:hypothetical protein
MPVCRLLLPWVIQYSLRLHKPTQYTKKLFNDYSVGINFILEREYGPKEIQSIKDQEAKDEHQTWIVKLKKNANPDVVARKYGFWNFGKVRKSEAYLFRIFNWHIIGNKHLDILSTI